MGKKLRVKSYAGRVSCRTSRPELQGVRSRSLKNEKAAQAHRDGRHPIGCHRCKCPPQEAPQAGSINALASC